MAQTDIDLVHNRRGMIVGASGFVGLHLARHLMSAGWTIHGFDRIHPSMPAFESTQGDLFDQSLLARKLAEVQPRVIFHLAGILKSDQPEALYRIHVMGTEALCDAVLEAGIKPLVIIAGSSAVYGAGLGNRPMTESFKPRPVTHYAMSKLAQEMMAFRYYQESGFPVICVRMFNLIGPGQPPNLVCSDFARQIAVAEMEGGDFITTGDLNARRDFVDVRDVAKAYEQSAIHGRPGQVYNICSGRAVSIRECLDGLLNLSSHPLRIVSDPKRMQKRDVSIQVGSAMRLRKLSGWQPNIPLQSSLADLLNDWRQIIRTDRSDDSQERPLDI